MNERHSRPVEAEGEICQDIVRKGAREYGAHQLENTEREASQYNDGKWASEGCSHPVGRRWRNKVKVSTPKESKGARGTHVLESAEGRTVQDTEKAR
jgi:hypothetical protein